MTAMFTINNHALRRMRTAAVSGTLAALTVGGALVAAGTAAADQIVENTYTIKGSDSVNVAIHCPSTIDVINGTRFTSASGTATNWSPFSQDLIIKGHCVNA